VLFADGVIYFTNNPAGWHRQAPAGNIVFVDTHLEPSRVQAAANLVW
jgi:hypothetical protein